MVPSPKLGNQRGILRYPASVLAPESALGLLPSIALSSAQVGAHSIESQEPVENALASAASTGVKNSRPERPSNGRFSGGHKWPGLTWPLRHWSGGSESN
jgi:hypothetical protein